MRATTDKGRLILAPETPSEVAALKFWQAGHDGRVLVEQGADGAVVLARLEPVNVHSGAGDPSIRSIGNLASARFTLDGERYTSVESFWQGLKLPEAERARIAALDGRAALEAARAHPYGATVTYRGETIPVGTWRHWRLMKRACWAKFTQSEPHRRALLATLPRPLEHRVRADSKAIPGVLMADIWMRIRERLAGAGVGPYPADWGEE
jgi:hypothetical protein